jgi:VIT1/CCC1 family predicted Fe2+/Mn2+ transporter
MDYSTPFFIFCLLNRVDRKSNAMSKHILRSAANLLIATAVIFFLYGLVHIIVELPAHERLRAIATVIVVSVVVGALFWVVGTTRPKV